MAVPVAPSHVVGPPLISAEEIAIRVAELGAILTEEYADTDLRLITVLKGGLFFLADLCRAIDLPLNVDFMAVSSYSGGAPGQVRITKDLDDSIEGSTVVVVEDIIDTGLTLNYILRNLRSRNPAHLKVCALLDKDVRRIVDLPIEHRGFAVPDRFLVGYGLDHEGLYRNLPYVACLCEEAFGA